MPENKTCQRIIVCGTNFGRIYLNGIKRMSGRCKLSGILSRGSRQSEACAREYQVPLYKSAEELDKTMADVVCVAVKSTVTGGTGTQIALECLEKGISVIQEQPVHYEDVCRCYQAALKNDCHYMVNNFYSWLGPCRTFAKFGKQLMKKAAPVYIDASCSIQVLYPLMDLLGQVTGTLSTWKIEKISKNDQVFSVLEGHIGGIPLSLRVENRMSVKDSDNFALMFHRIALFTESGQLNLDQSVGLVFWEPRYYVRHTDDGCLDLYGSASHSGLKVTEILNREDIGVSYQDLYDTVWPSGIEKAVSEFLSKLDGSADKRQMQYQLNICRLWNDAGRCLGPAKAMEEPKIMPLTAKNIMEEIK